MSPITLLISITFAATIFNVKTEIITAIDSEYNLAPRLHDNTDNCGFNLRDLKPGASGQILTPDYPTGYSPNLRCIWWIKVFCSTF